MLTLGGKSLPVEVLAMPDLGLDAMPIDDNIMKVFGAKLDWAAERLSFRDSNIVISAMDTKKLSGHNIVL